jgi:hypothetical protein
VIEVAVTGGAAVVDGTVEGTAVVDGGTVEGAAVADGPDATGAATSGAWTAGATTGEDDPDAAGTGVTKEEEVGRAGWRMRSSTTESTPLMAATLGFASAAMVITKESMAVNERSIRAPRFMRASATSASWPGFTWTITLFAFVPSPLREGKSAAEAGTRPESVAARVTRPSESLPVEVHFLTRFFTQEVSDDFFKTEHVVWSIEPFDLLGKHVSWPT